MNSKILNQYGLELRKTNDGLHDITGHWLSSYLYIYRHIEYVSEFIADIILAINGQYNKIEDPDWTGSLGSTFFAEIRPNEFAIWQDGITETLIPLEDMKEILVSWKEFLET